MASASTRLAVNPDRVRRCVSQKAGFPSYEAALDLAELMMGLGHVSPGCHITPYHCDQCDEWHVYNRRIVPVR